MKSLVSALAIGLLAALGASQAQATVVVTYAEQAGALNSSFINATTFDFNNLSTGVQKNVVWNGVGVFDQLNVLKADQYGGALNTKYSVQGVGSSVKATTFNLNTPSSYFGLWWSAGDSTNILDFYSGPNGTGTLLAEFTTANLIKTLPKAYFGNPNAGSNFGKNATEAYAFINFFGTPDTAWASVVLRNSTSSGFESDNYSSRVAAWVPAVDGPMPGIVLESIVGTKETLAQAPEASTTLALILFAGFSFGGSLLRRFNKKA